MTSQSLLLSGLVLYLSFSTVLCGEELGAIPSQGFRSPEGDSRLSSESGLRPLNNLVFELLNLERPESTPHRFRNPRDGWVYLRVTVLQHSSEPVVVRLSGTPCELRFVEGAFEGMYYRKAGMYEIQTDSNAEAIQRLEVRAVGDLVYSTFGMNPHIEETGVYPWEFLKQHCLDHYNGIIGLETLAPDGTLAQEAEVREWTAQGKRWFTREPLPFDVKDAEECSERWGELRGHAASIDEWNLGR